MWQHDVLLRAFFFEKGILLFRLKVKLLFNAPVQIYFFSLPLSWVSADPLHVCSLIFLLAVRRHVLPTPSEECSLLFPHRACLPLPD